MSVVGERFVIVQLYPNELGVTGDRGNVLALATRLERSGAVVELVTHHRGGVLPPSPDIVVIGNGPLSAMRLVREDISANALVIRQWVSSGVPVLAVGAGMEILGTQITTSDGEKILGVGALPISTVRSGVRRVGYVVVESDAGKIVGFEDHSSTTILDSGKAFGRVTRGVASLVHGDDGVAVANAVGTRIQGPILPLNPLLSDHLITAAATRRGMTWKPNESIAELGRLASEARAVIEKNIDHDFSSI
ncbi:MAG: type 1 glutamine amidotransferase [Microbacteriaceae bacterium]